MDWNLDLDLDLTWTWDFKLETASDQLLNAADSRGFRPFLYEQGPLWMPPKHLSGKQAAHVRPSLAQTRPGLSGRRGCRRA